MSVIASGIVLSIGLAVSVLAIWLNWKRTGRSTIMDEPKTTVSTKPMDERLRLEYETLNEEIRRRGDLVSAIAGSLFVVTSFVLLGQATQMNDSFSKLLTSLTAIGVYAFWYFGFGFTSGWLDATTFKKLHELEKSLGIAVHTYIAWKIQKDFKRWIVLRRQTWSLLLLFETIVAAVIVFYP